MYASVSVGKCACVFCICYNYVPIGYVYPPYEPAYIHFCFCVHTVCVFVFACMVCIFVFLSGLFLCYYFSCLKCILGFSWFFSVCFHFLCVKTCMCRSCLSLNLCTVSLSQYMCVRTCEDANGCLPVSACLCVHTCPSVCLSQHHESVELATAETSKAGLRASSFWLDRSLCFFWETQQQREKRTNPPSSSTPVISSVSQWCALQLSLLLLLFTASLSLFLLPFFHCPVLCCPPFPPSLPLNSSCSLFLSPLFLGLCTSVKSRRPFVKFKAVLRFWQVPGGSLRT